MFPDSVQIGSWTVTKNTLVLVNGRILIGMKCELTHQEMSLRLGCHAIDLEHLDEHVDDLAYPSHHA
jgi:hypothetical protein